MTRAGREPTEDVRRAFRRAIEFAGLDVHKIQMMKSDESGGRVVFGWAKPEWWQHDCPAIEMSTLVKFDGHVEMVNLRCAACDDDPDAHVFDAPHLQGCLCSLAELPQVLKEVWAARGSVLRRWQDGEPLPIHDGRWTWAQPDPSPGEYEP
jgi:hypothetical protein